MKSVLVASQDQALIAGIKKCLSRGFRVDQVGRIEECLDQFKRKRREFTFIDLDLIDNGQPLGTVQQFKDMFQPYWQAFPSAQIIVVCRQEHIRRAVAAVKAGASNYLMSPISPEEVEFVLGSLYEFQKMESELQLLRDKVWRTARMEGTRTNSPLMMDVLNKVRSVSATKTTVLLTGETGVGKGVLARLIHNLSNRTEGPFVAVHCGAIPDTLLESEFFGHEKGAFTGAVKRKLGKFQIGDNGTIFLDEIGTLSQSAQVKMLQVLQEKSFSRVGGEEFIEVDIRLVAATNQDLKKLCEEGRFREDLYFRLNVFPIEVPPLRKRPEDIPLLIETFLEQLNHLQNKDIRGVTPEVMDALLRYNWPGNIRELENLIERAYILEKGPLLTAESFPSELFALEKPISERGTNGLPTLEEVRRRALEQVERRYLRDILLLHKGRIDQTAATAGVTSRQLHNLMQRFGLHKEEFKQPIVVTKLWIMNDFGITISYSAEYRKCIFFYIKE